MTAKVSPQESQMIDLGVFSSSFAIRGLGAIGFCHIYSQWSKQSTAKFQLAVEKVVQLNPILSGYMVHGKENFDHVLTNQFFDFVEIEQYHGEATDFTSLPLQERLRYLECNVLPLIAPLGTGVEQLKNKSRLFHTKVIEFGDEVVGISIQMSHSLGDGSTHSKIVDSIMRAMNGQEVLPLDWTSPLNKTHNGIGGDSSSKFEAIKFLFAFLGGILNLKLFGPKRNVTNVLVSKEKLEEMKKSLKGENIDFLSSNDVLTAAVYEASKTTDLLLMAVNLRQRDKAFGDNLAGNFMANLPLPKETCTDPNAVRLGMKNLDWGAPKKSLTAIMRGRYGSISNGASFASNMEVAGAQYVCKVRLDGLLKTVPSNTVFVYPFDKETLCLHHNIPTGDLDLTKNLGKLILQ